MEVDSSTIVFLVLSEIDLTLGKSDSIQPIGSIGQRRVYHSATNGIEFVRTYVIDVRNISHLELANPLKKCILLVIR